MGNSFNVGEFLGMNVDSAATAPTVTIRGNADASSSNAPAPSVAMSSSTAENAGNSATSPFGADVPPSSALSSQAETIGTATTFATARSSLPLTPQSGEREDLFPFEDSPNTAVIPGPILTRPASSTSTTALLSPEVRFQAEGGDEPAGPSRPALRDTAHSDGELQLQKPPKKKKSVHYADAYAETAAPPDEVLARSGDEVAETSAGAAEEASPENEVRWGDVVMRGRPLHTSDSR
jgi:hypothetical protein